MKQKVVTIIVSIFSNLFINAQDVVNPYNNYNGQPMPNYSIPISVYPFYYNFTTDLSGQYSSTNYNGEYMIQFNLLWWFNKYPLGGNFKDLYSKSYKVEVVSFPFVMNCAYTTGCADGSTTTRNLEMPNYALSNEQWGANVWRKRENLTTNISNSLGEASDLITLQFHNNTALPTTGQPFYPHTVHKFTLYLHCGTSINDPVGDSLIFLYDLTRGRMREYPFITQNSLGIGGSTDWDIVFRPRLVFKDFGLGHSYGENTNSDIYINGKTINYFPFNNGNDCDFVLNNDFFFDASNSAFLVTPPASYCLTSFLIYTQYGYSYLAGYKADPLNSNLLSIRQGIKHTYSIQNNIDLTEINPSERIIYNPSEVNITASNLIFPSEYIFKTICGVYPTESEVNADNVTENGGPFSDLRDVPVTTDLSSENASDPVNDPVYASRYYMKNGSKLTIQSCARLFDVAFDVEQGSTMIIEDYSQMIGQEDKSSNPGRYKIRGLGGAMLRNTAPVQYVQNGNITQTYPLYYTATDKIIAGAEVDTDLDAITGDYVLQPYADVTFHANHIIRLKPGFRAKSGSRFTARCDNNVTQFPICISSNRFMSPGAIHENDPSPSGTPTLQLYPNPTTGALNFARENSEAQPGKVEVFDGRGKLILEQIYSVSPLPQLDLSEQSDGIYLVKVTQGNSSRSAKVVLNRE